LIGHDDVEPAAACQFALTLKIPPAFRNLLLLGCLNSLSLRYLFFFIHGFQKGLFSELGRAEWEIAVASA